MHDHDTLEAIRRKAYGLAKISGERLWTELHRILQGNFKKEIFETMMDLELTQYIGIHLKMLLRLHSHLLNINSLLCFRFEQI